MTYLEAAFKLYEVMTLVTAVTLVSGHQWNPRQQMMYAAENRALQGFGYARRSACSRVSCGLDCNRDERCKSFNFNNGNKTCELNLATTREHPGAFCVTPGSVYFDADKDTPYHSLTDISLKRPHRNLCLINTRQAAVIDSNVVAAMGIYAKYECLVN